MKIVSIFGGHDANVTFVDTEKNKYHVIEIERLVKKRYFRLHVDNPPQTIFEILNNCQQIAEKYWNFTNDYDTLVFVKDGWIDLQIVSSVFKFKNVKIQDHHHSHAAGVFYQSPFTESMIISYDGGGNDGHFNVYLASNNEIKLVEKINCDFGGGYLLLSSCCTEITKSSKHMLSLAGKMMGLCAYGKKDTEKIKIMKNLFIDKNYKKVSELGNYNLKNVDNPWNNPLENYIFEGQQSFDFAANAQKAYEEMFLEIFNLLINKYSLKNICLTGGGALNVLLNQYIKDNFNLNIFVPPNPNDCGLSIGASFLTEKPINKIDITYKGIPLLDIDSKQQLLQNRKTEPVNLEKICYLLKAGKIIGICQGDSEVGPRALGNRSIICDPSYKNMKDILNAKVKFREWYRPFAPFCLEEDAATYFESKNFNNMEFMSYAPIVKKEYREALPSITHVDNSSRLQTVSKLSHKFLYDLLIVYKHFSNIPVLLNTSFNIRGNPILTTIEDALYVLDNTELDYVIVEGTLVCK